MKNIVLVTYTNSNCSDIWKAYFGRIEKFFPETKSMILSDIEFQSENHYCTVYSNSKPYFQVWTDFLERIEEDYFIYMQEDFFLYDSVIPENIDKLVDFLDNNLHFSFIRLIKSGQLEEVQVHNQLYLIKPDNINCFSMQPTIWRKTDFIKLYNEVKATGWLETSGPYFQKMNELGIVGLYTYNGEKKRGEAHYDSSIFPYVATGIIKGKWNYKEYSKEIDDLAKEYNIDVSKRGKFE